MFHNKETIKLRKTLNTKAARQHDIKVYHSTKGILCKAPKLASHLKTRLYFDCIRGTRLSLTGCLAV